MRLATSHVSPLTSHQPMRVLFLNQYFPPDPAPTGVLLREVADRLRADGHEVDFVAARQDYRAGQQRGGRMLRELKALGSMLLDGLRRRRADVVISGTSPPCLLVVATLVAAWHRARSIHWVMDLYPEIAVALGEVGEGLLCRAIRRLMGWCYRRCAAVVVLDADMAARLRLRGVATEIIRPWIFERIASEPLPFITPEPPWTWIYSGNLGRAHEWETLLRVQAVLEERGTGIRLLLQGGGPSWPAAQARARELGLRQCEFKPYVPEEELRASLMRCHCCAVTQLPAAQGLLWPSKLGLLLTLPRPIVWVGPVDGAIAAELGRLPHAGVFSPGDAQAIAGWLADLSRRSFYPASAQIVDGRAHRQASLDAWARIVAAIGDSGRNRG